MNGHFLLLWHYPILGKKDLRYQCCTILISYGDEADVLDKGNRIQVLLNLLWRQKFRSKVNKIYNSFNKRSLPLKCFKGEGNYHPFFWEFFKFWKIPSNSLTLSYHLVLNRVVQLGIFQILISSLKLSSVH